MTDAPHSDGVGARRRVRPRRPDLRRDGRPLPGLPRPAAHGGRGARRAAAGVRRARGRGAAGARPRLRLGRLDPGGARRLVGRAAARPTACRSPGSTPPRGWSAQARAKTWPAERHAGGVRRRRPTSSRCRAARSTASSPPTCCATCPTAPGWSPRWPGCCAPGAASSSTTTPSPAAPGPRAVWAAVCHGIIIPLAVVKRSDVPLHRYLYTSVRDFDSVAAHLRAAAVGRPRRRAAPVVPGLAARPGAHRRRVGAVMIPGRTRALDPRARPAGRVPPATRSGDHAGCRARAGIRAARRRRGRRHRGADRRAGAGRARRAGHRARARGAARRPGAVVAGGRWPTASAAR